MDNFTEPLKNIVYISIPENFKNSDVAGIDPSILLPVELSPNNSLNEISNLSWEMIIAAMLKIIAHNPEHKNADYFRKLVLLIRPDIVNEMTNAAIAKASEKDYDIAEEIFLALRNLQPGAFAQGLNLALLYEERADSYSAINRLDLAENYNDKAFELYKELVELNGDSADARFNFGLFYLKRSSFDKAAEQLELFLTLSNDGKKKKKVKEIISQLNSKKENDDLFFTAYDAIKMGKEDEAIDKIKNYLEKEDSIWNAWFLLGWAYRRKNMYSEGAEAFRKALELGSDQLDLYNELAICLMELGKLEESREYLLKALKNEPDNIKILSNLGIVAMKEDDQHTAEQYFRKVLAIEPDDKIAAAYLSQL